LFDETNPNFATFPHKTPKNSQEKEKPIKQNREITLANTWESGKNSKPIYRTLILPTKKRLHT
jgi:hypothetical protein